MATRSILYVCDFNGPGGTQTHLLHLLAGLDRRRFRPALATLNLDPRLAERLEALEVTVTNLGLRGAVRLSTWRAVRKLAAAARRERTALVHGFLFQGNLLAAAVSLLGRTRCVTSVRNVDAGKRWRDRRLSRMAHARAARVVFNSKLVRDFTLRREGISPEKAVVIFNGVEDCSLAPPPRTGAGPRIVCVASLREKKGHRHLLDALSRLRPRYPDLRLLLAGEGPLREPLERMAGSMGLAGAVEFLGHRPDVASVLASADIFVMSSLEEGMPNALLEAMSAGLPPVVTRVGGNEEVVGEGEAGLLVPAADPAALASALDSLLGDEERRRRMGSAARRRFEQNFTIDRMIAAYQSLYDEVLGA